MRFVFFGTPEFAAHVLERLIKHGFLPTLLITNPDRPFGRKKVVTPPPAKRLIISGGWQIEILQPENLSGLIDQLKTFDFAIVAAYSKILPKEILEAPKHGFIGVHPSLLPKYRGASPIQSAILHGETETGVTLYQMDEKVDHGGIISNVKVQISNEDAYETLEKKLAELAGDLLAKTLPKFAEGKREAVPQDERGATITKKFKTEDGYVDPAELIRAETEGGDIALQIHRKIRALSSEPGVYTMRNGKRLKLLSATIENEKLFLRQTQREGMKPSLKK